MGDPCEFRYVSRMQDDRELLVAWRSGDKTAGKQLFERHYDGIARFFRSKLGGGVEDLVQQVFVACVNGRDRLRDDSSFRAYLYATAHNVLRNHFRRRHNLSESTDFGEEQALVDLAPGLSTLRGQVEQERLLLEAVRRIPLNYQLVIELRFWERMSTAEIAEVLGAPPATVRSRLQRALQLLKRQMAELGAAPARLRSTLDDLERWAGRLRARFDQDA